MKEGGEVPDCIEQLERSKKDKKEETRVQCDRIQNMQFQYQDIMYWRLIFLLYVQTLPGMHYLVQLQNNGKHHIALSLTLFLQNQ